LEYEEKQVARKNLLSVPSKIYLEKKVEENMERSEVLQ
jgi:hypothetical protein